MVCRKSLPPREAWIEIEMPSIKATETVQSLPSRKAWIEIEMLAVVRVTTPGRFPRRKRGLKYMPKLYLDCDITSLPSREAGGRTFGGFCLLSSASRGPLPLDKRGFVSLY